MKDFNETLRATFASLLVDRWGIANIEGCPWPVAADFNRAVSFFLAYQYDLNNYDESAFHALLLEKQRAADSAVTLLCLALKQINVPHLPVPPGQDQTSLKAAFPHKYAATRAGLGWIGKNSLLITPESGPRVFLRTILFKADAAPAVPIEQSNCKDCHACVDACPISCIEGNNWQPGLGRDELLDAFACDRFRLGRTPELGHKDSCGFCLLACPIGTRER